MSNFLQDFTRRLPPRMGVTKINGIFGKIGRFAFEEVVLQWVNSKYIPALLHGL